MRKLPGLEIRIWVGPVAQANDARTTLQEDGNGLYISSQPRALLENFQIARARANDEPKTIAKQALELCLTDNYASSERAARAGWRN